MSLETLVGRSKGLFGKMSDSLLFNSIRSENYLNDNVGSMKRKRYIGLAAEYSPKHLGGLICAVS